MDCSVCASRPPYDRSLMCGGCYARLRADIRVLVGAHTWLGVAMLNPTPAWKPGTIGHTATASRPPFRTDLHDARVDISGKLASWARVAVEEHIPVLMHGPADSQPETVARWLLAQLPWISDQPWCGEMARELTDAARAAYALVPWERSRRELPLPCPGCGFLTLTLYGGDEVILCRYRECGRTLTWGDYWTAVRDLTQDGAILPPIVKPPTSNGAAA